MNRKTKRILLDHKIIFNEAFGDDELFGGGVVAIGQKLECDKAFFNSKWSFKGKISSLNMWSRDVMRDVSCSMFWFNDSCVVNLNKPVIAWSDLDFFTSGNVSRVLKFDKCVVCAIFINHF